VTTRTSFTLAVVAGALLTVSLIGCSGKKSEPAPTAEHKSESATKEAGAPTLCEHKVPAELCTKCHPELAAVFKAQNDWCNEHGVPESQCFECNPKLSFEGPPKDDPAKDYCREHAVPESMCTKCHPNLVAEFIAKGDFCREHGFPESVCPRCHPELAEKVGLKATFPEPGTKVRLASEELVEAAGIETTVVEERPFAESLEVVGRLTFNQNRLAQVSSRGDALVAEVLVDLGDEVKRGQALVVVQSAAAGEDRARLASAQASSQAAKAALSRRESLQGIASQREVEEARRDVASTQAEVDAATAALRASGADPSASAGGRLVLISPFAGTVVARNAVAGRNVAGGDVLIEVADISTMWAELEIPEESALLVKPAQRVVLQFEGTTQKREAKISRVAASVDQETRTVPARVELDNADRTLKAGLFFRARIELTGTKGALLVPKEAVQTAEGQRLVFVDRGGGVFDPLPVVVGQHTSTSIEITSGLEPGLRVVTAGAFLLKTEVLKDSIGAGCADD